MRTVIMVLLLSIFYSGNSQSPDKKTGSSDLKWSVKMANTVLKRSDSLIYYVDRNPKWAYDVALLGMAVDRLGTIHPKYSKYMETWVDYFVKADGSVIDYRDWTYEYYVNEKRIDNDTKGVAPFIMAAIELGR